LPPCRRAPTQPTVQTASADPHPHE
jgi:hypothetical protein